MNGTKLSISITKPNVPTILNIKLLSNEILSNQLV